MTSSEERRRSSGENHGMKLAENYETGYLSASGVPCTKYHVYD